MNINIKNGITIYKNNTYKMYHMYFPNTLEFFMCIPNNTYNSYKMIIDFSEIDFTNEDINIDDLVSASFSEKINKVYEKFPTSIYIISQIPLSEFNDAINENDDRLYKLLLDKIITCKNNAYWSLVNASIFEDDIKIEKEINIMKQSNEDVKLFWWLDINNIKGYKQIELFDKPKIELPEFVPITVNNNIKPPEDKKIPIGDEIHSTGYSNISFIITVLIISGIMGTCLAYLILR